GVLANDTVGNSANLELAVVDPPSHGTATLAADGSFVYQPNVSFVGDDSFTYQITVGADTSNIATVNISVTNTAPVAENDSYDVLKGNTLTVDALTGVLANDSDANEDDLTAVNASDPAHGTLTLNLDGSFTYTPDVGFSGTDTFTYQANDGDDSSAPA